MHKNSHVALSGHSATERKVSTSGDDADTVKIQECLKTFRAHIIYYNVLEIERVTRRTTKS